jgi:hypothetical protein
VKTKEYCKRQSNTCLQLSKQSLIALGDVAKGYMRNPQIACKAIMLATYRWETVALFNLKKWRRVQKFCSSSTVFITMKAYPTILLLG